MDPIITVLVGAGAGAVGSGLVEGGKRMVARRQKPQLSLSLDPSLVRSGPPVIRVGGHPCAFFRLLVSNAQGKEAARGVHVEVRNFQDRAGQPSPEASGLDGSWLAWSESEPLNPQAEKQPTTIGPGEAQRVDLVHLNSKHQGDEGERYFHFDVRPQPPDARNHVAASELTFEVVVSGHNCDPRSYELTLAYDGDFWPGVQQNARERLQIGPPRAL